MSRAVRVLPALGWVVTLAVAAAAVATVMPAWAGLSEVTGFAHVVALRGLACLAALTLSVLLFLAGLARRRGRRRRGRRRAGSGAVRTLVLAVVIAGVGLAHGAIQLARGWSAPTTTGGLTVIAFNTQGEATAAVIADLADRERAAAIALPETSEATARAAAAELARRGRPFRVFAVRQGSNPLAVTSLLVSAELGPYRRIEAPYMELGAVRVAPADGDGPVFAAVHPPPPLPLRFGMEDWAVYAATAAGMCRELPGSIVAGDFNATLDHAPLRDLGRCDDAAAAAGAGAQGTWPARLPVVLASPIDHVLFDAGRWRARSTRAVRAGGSDHRALIARLAPR